VCTPLIRLALSWIGWKTQAFSRTSIKIANTTSLLKQKLGAKNHSDLIRIAVEMGLR
jgi:hypothetical protein